VGQLLPDVPVGVDDERHHGPFGVSIDDAIIGHGSAFI
jgi:hypothetical protein